MRRLGGVKFGESWGDRKHGFRLGGGRARWGERAKDRTSKSKSRSKSKSLDSGSEAGMTSSSRTDLTATPSLQF